MKYLIYLSTAIRFMPDEELVELLVAARRKNEMHQVTGVLLYSGGTFLQVLEGMPANVDTIFKTIESDKRHKSIIMLIDEPLQKRNFADWSMGFMAASPELVDNIAGYLKTTDTITDNNNGHLAISVLKNHIEISNLSLNRL